MKYFLILLLAAGCKIVVPPDAGPPDVVLDASYVDAKEPRPIWNPLDPCTSARNLMGWLGCSPLNAETGSWVIVCQNARQNGQKFGTECIHTTVNSKEDVKKCGVTCQ